jgi:hypothetical protein
MADEEMRRIAETLPTRERGDAVWNTSNLAVHLTRIGLMQSSEAGRFSPRSSLVGMREAPKLAHRPFERNDAWPLT